MKSFAELCSENYTRIYKYIFGMTGGRESAEDLLQDVFIIAFQKGESFLRHENPPAFLYRTARNLTLTYLKKQRRCTDEPLDDVTADGDTDLCEKLLRTYDRQIDEDLYTGQVISRLEGSQQTLYALRYVERQPIRDIARSQNTSEPAMRMRLMRLRREIVNIVKDLGLDETHVT
jgi:RNA polymerase sigma-70 factor (ECF subfamily)